MSRRSVVQHDIYTVNAYIVEHLSSYRRNLFIFNSTYG